MFICSIAHLHLILVQEEGKHVEPHLLLHSGGDGGQDEGHEVRADTKVFAAVQVSFRLSIHGRSIVQLS